MIHNALYNNQNTGHIVFLDFLRVVAVFMVVMLHVAGRGMKMSGVAGTCGFSWDISNAFVCLCSCAVSCLVMISGALFLGREIPVKRLLSKYILRMVRVFVLWSFFYAVCELFYSLSHHLPLSIADFVCFCLEGHYHLWFLFMISGLYLVVPFLRKIAVDSSLCHLFLLCGFVFAVLVPEIIAVLKLVWPQWGCVCASLVEKTHLYFFLGYPVYFMWGYWLSRKAISGKNVWICAVLGILGVAITFWLTSFATITTFGTKYAGEYDRRFYEASNVTVFLPASGLFVVCKYCLEKANEKGKLAQVLASWSRHSFGVYLIHAFVLHQFESKLHLWGLAFHPLGAIPVTSLAVFFMSLAAAAFLSRIPYLGKWLF